MPAELKPIKVWGQGGPNPPKVAMILEELRVPYEIIPYPITDVKKPEYTALNPNGRLPTIQDPNTNLTLWESGAIIEYLIERYDPEHLISFEPGTADYYHAKQWLFFQTSGQAPYYGQAAWFQKFHHEKLPSALNRYVKEMHRVSGVLEGWLKKQSEEHSSTDGPWLVGNKLSFADIAFVQWQKVIVLIIAKEDFSMGDYPLLEEWIEKISARSAIKKVLEQSLQPAS